MGQVIFNSTNLIMPHQFVQNKFVQEFVAVSLLKLLILLLKFNCGPERTLFQRTTKESAKQKIFLCHVLIKTEGEALVGCLNDALITPNKLKDIYFCFYFFN